MHRPSEELLSRAALALDEHRRVRLAHASHDREELAHDRRFPEDVLEAGHRLRRARVLLRLRLEGLEIRRPLQDHFERSERDGLGVIVECTELHGSDRVLAVFIAGQDDDLRRGRRLDDLLERPETLLGAVRMWRQPEVQAHQLRMFPTDHVERLASLLGEEEHEVIPERVLELRPNRLIVVHNQQLGLVVHPRPPLPSGSLIVKVVPTPSRLETSMLPPWAATIPLL